MFEEEEGGNSRILDLFCKAMAGQKDKNSQREPTQSPPQFDVSTERSLINLTPQMRTSLEDRFIEILHQYPCFFDPSDKNFAHNQYKSNSYAEIARTMNAEGLETSGPQLAAIFKGIKAKYRDETRKMQRMDGKVEPSAFYCKLKFLETGLSTVDQRNARLRYQVRQTPPLRRTDDVSPSSSPPNSASNARPSSARIGGTSAAVITPSVSIGESSALQTILEKVSTDPLIQDATARFVSAMANMAEEEQLHFYRKFIQAANICSVFTNATINIVSVVHECKPCFQSFHDGTCDESEISDRGANEKLKTNPKYRAMLLKLADGPIGSFAYADPVKTDKEKAMLQTLSRQHLIYRHGHDEFSDEERRCVFNSVANQMKARFPDVTVEWVRATLEGFLDKYIELKGLFAKHKNVTKPEFLWRMTFIEYTRNTYDETEFLQNGCENGCTISEATENGTRKCTEPVKRTEVASQDTMTDIFGVSTDLSVGKQEPPINVVAQIPSMAPLPPLTANADVLAIIRFFESNVDLLAMFRVLGHAVTKLPNERRFNHIQALLNITNAAQFAPLTVEWKTRVYNPTSGEYVVSSQLQMVEGPAPENGSERAPILQQNGANGIQNGKRPRPVDDSMKSDDEDDEHPPPAKRGRSLDRLRQNGSNRRESSPTHSVYEFRMPQRQDRSNHIVPKKRGKRGRPKKLD